MEGATHAPIYSITCEPNYNLNTDRKHMECRGGDWLPQKPQCLSVNKIDDIPSKYGKTLSIWFIQEYKFYVRNGRPILEIFMAP